jgi:hypothetical protein
VNKINPPDSDNINGQSFYDNLVSKSLPETLDSVSVTRIFKRNLGRLNGRTFYHLFCGTCYENEKLYLNLSGVNNFDFNF